MRPRSRKCLLADLLVQDDPTNAGSSTEGGLPRRPEPSEEPPLNSRITEGARLGGGITYTLCFDGQETPLSPHPSALAPESALQHLLPVVAECDAIQTQKHLLRRCLAPRLYECRDRLVRPRGHLADRPNERGGGRTGRRLQSRGRHVGTGRSWGTQRAGGGGAEGWDTIKLGTYETTGVTGVRGWFPFQIWRNGKVVAKNCPVKPSSHAV